MVRADKCFAFLYSVITLVLVHASLVSAEGQCIKGRYHKDKPSPKDGTFKSCEEYAEINSCCTAEFTVELNATRAQKLYNHTWEPCTPLSKRCEAFWMHQECFYQCSPYVYKWAHPVVKEGIHGVPICSSYCDAWFDACKDDQTCVQDVLTGYTFLPNGTNVCPVNSSCITYKEMFKDGKGLCNKMWNTSYIYTQENTDRSNCLVMHFIGKNPNKFFNSSFNLVNAAVPPSTASFVLMTLFSFAAVLHLKID